MSFTFCKLLKLLLLLLMLLLLLIFIVLLLLMCVVIILMLYYTYCRRGSLLKNIRGNKGRRVQNVSAQARENVLQAAAARPQGQNNTRAADIRRDAAAQKAAATNGVPTAPGVTKAQKRPGATAAAAKPPQILPPVQYPSQ